jgi:hypothetical protein
MLPQRLAGRRAPGITIRRMWWGGESGTRVQIGHVSLAGHAHATGADPVVGRLPHHRRWPVAWFGWLAGQLWAGLLGRLG